LAQAVNGVVDSFIDLTGATGAGRRDLVLKAKDEEELLVALLEEVVYWLDTAGEVPVGVELAALPGGLQVSFQMADVGSLPLTGATPKAVTLHGLAFDRGPEGWSCSVTLDV
jgi:SHS2 domain-containing protein